MTWGDLITWSVRIGLLCVVIYAIRRMGRPHNADVSAAISADAPHDHVQLVVVMPNKGAVRHAKVLLDGADVAWQRTDTSMSCDTVPGLHQLSAKAGFRSNQWSIECVDNGRYEVYLKADALMGGFQNEIRVAKCTASAQT